MLPGWSSAGSEYRLPKNPRIGVEFDATFDNFSNTVYESFEQTSVVPFKE